LKLAVNHIWPTTSLERIALHPGALGYELAGGDGEVREWQRAEFGPSLEQLASDYGW
jgi:hypothetical protein